ncbi:MAG TPA: LysR substrate-binding domain-containing protein [Sphingomonas sp.]|nr:LysR substrate-binding domain-containing protein [Sphingomonas sp.]
MLRQTPPLAATEAFLAAAGARSFRAAAASLALSPSAFSRRIQLLEAFLGVPLFHRSGARAELTIIGARYLAEIAPAVEAIRRASAAIRTPEREKLRLATSHSLAVEWLLPRLPVAMRESGTRIELVVATDRDLLKEGCADLAIWGGREPEGESEPLITLDAVPATCARPNPPGNLDELVTRPMLAVRNPPDVWAQWLAAVGYDGPPPRIAAVYDTNQLSYEAAASGLGVSLAVPLLANRYLQDERLVPCAARPAPTGMAYWIHHAENVERRDPIVRRLTDWLKQQAVETKQEFLRLARH